MAYTDTGQLNYGTTATPVPSAGIPNYGGTNAASPFLPGDTQFGNALQAYNGFDVANGAELAVNGQMPGQGQGQGAFSKLFGGEGGGMQGFGSLLGGVGGLFGAWNGYQQLKEAKRQHGDNMAFANRNVQEQAKALQYGVDDKRKSRSASFGGNQGPSPTQFDGSKVV